MAELDMNLERVLAEHKLRRRSFLNKMVLAPAAISSTGLLANVMAVGRAWGVTVPVTTIGTQPVTTLVTVPTTTVVTFPATTVLTQPVTLPATTLFTVPVTFPPATDFTLPVSLPISNTVPEPATAVLVCTGIAAAIAMTARYRAAAEGQAAAELDREIADRPGE
jgi:hypothetical protein